MRSQWLIPYPPDAVFAVLADGDGYPSWWPQIRDAARLDEASGRARFRSFLPVSLDVTLREELVDPIAGVLRARLDGDLAGWSQWTVHPDADAEYTVVHFVQQVDFTKHVAVVPLWPLRPFLRANHAYMMRSGRRGLVRHLAEITARDAGVRH